ncbi:MAG: imidazole glycerol phosphate synthase subunit HisH [Candidatus Thorarchaeota archaeon]|nr:imidazole glycerol phosphate synthase subunit HisH [Candidatus Thorarchaeota archaeon]
MMKVGVINYGAGNLLSILNGLKRTGIETLVITNPVELKELDAVVIPGVGNFAHASGALEPFREIFRDIIKEGRYVLGICLGMQILFENSEEGVGEGLGALKGRVVRFSPEVKVPHMGWNTLDIIKQTQMTDGISDSDYFYFVHSYYATGLAGSHIVARTDYSVKFPSMIVKDSLVGVQFHPEKSSKNGVRVLQNFRDMISR